VRSNFPGTLQKTFSCRTFRSSSGSQSANLAGLVLPCQIIVSQRLAISIRMYDRESLFQSEIKMSRSQGYVIVINNPGIGDEQTFLALDAKYMVYQYEVGGKQNTLHLQGYVFFKHQRFFTAMKKLLPRAHIEAAKGSPEENKAYCTKEEGRVDGPYEFGICPKIGRPKGKSKMQDVADGIKAGMSVAEIKDQFPTWYMRYHNGIEKMVKPPGRTSLGIGMPRVQVYWGVPGSGKSYRAEREAMARGSVYHLHKNGPNYWWDGYDGQTSVIINDFYGHYPYSELLNLLDCYDNTVNPKGHTKIPFISKYIYITSNKHPYQWYKEEITGKWLCKSDLYPNYDKPVIKCALERRIATIVEFASVFVMPVIPEPPQSPVPPPPALVRQNAVARSAFRRLDFDASVTLSNPFSYVPKL